MIIILIQVLVIVDAQLKQDGLPTQAYIEVEEVHDVSANFPFATEFIPNVQISCQDGTPSAKTFEHVSSEIGAEEAEEVGVEHLLRLNNSSFFVFFLHYLTHAFNIFFRDIKDVTVGTLSQRIANQLAGLDGLLSYLKDIHKYLRAVSNGELPVNHSLMNLLQVKSKYFLIGCRMN